MRIVLSSFGAVVLLFTSACANPGRIVPAGIPVAQQHTLKPQSLGRWKNKPAMFFARYGLAAAVAHSKLYAVGGNDLATDLGVNEAYDPKTNTWTIKASMPTPRRLLGAGSINGIVYAVGGYNGSTTGPQNALEAYDPLTDTWSTKASMPTARYGLGVGVVHGILYAIGGYGGAYLATVEAYNPVTDTWTTKASMPVAMVYPSVTGLDGRLYVISGQNSSGTGADPTVQVYNPDTDTWKLKASVNTARAAAGAAASGDTVYAVGGVAADNSLLDSVEAFDRSENTWTFRAPMPENRGYLAAATLGGRIYALGGIEFVPAEIVTNAVDAYSPPD